MPYITVQDGTKIYYKDWGNKEAQPIVFSHGWPLSSDDWENQMFFFASHGFRVIAHDRRGHGRSDQPWDGNNMDTYADDVAELFNHLDVRNAVMVGHSTGGGEVARYLGRHGSERVAKAALVSAVPPHLVKSSDNPRGVPKETLDSFREAMIKDRAQFFLDVPSGPFFNFDQPNAQVSQGKIWAWWKQGMDCGFKNAYDCIEAFSETDFTGDLQSITIPVLVLHGDADQVVPIDAAGRRSVKLLQKGLLKEVKGASHALPTAHAEDVNRELLEFIRS